MPSETDRARLRGRLKRVARRRRIGALAWGGAMGAATAVLILVALRLTTGLPLGSPIGIGFGILLTGIVAGGGVALHLLDRGEMAAARAVERGSPTSRNLVRTGAELALDPEPRIGADPDHERVRAAVLADAARFLEGVDEAALVPLARPVAAAVGFAALGAVLALGLGSSPGETATGSGPAGVAVSEVDSGTGPRFRVEIHPPTWIGGDPRTVESPDQIEALAGSRLELEVGVPVVDDGVVRVRAETVEGDAILESDGPGVFRSSHPVETDGFLAIEGLGADGRARFRRLVGITAVADEPPVLRLAEPGRDLLFADGERTVDVVVEATDDHALSELELVYTRVSGFGEVFEFLEGSIPLRLERSEPGRWTGRATWDLAPLALERGEYAVYHARGRDRRPGAPDAVSDSWMVEVVGSEAAVAGGFAGDDEMTRYGMSQQMVLVLMERLDAGRDTLSAPELLVESRILAAAQRRVRAEFVFMLGGELEDDDHVIADDGLQDLSVTDPGLLPVDPSAPVDLHEEAHARADQAAAEGRLAQQGRQELSRAVLAMAQTAAYLERSDLDPARAAGQLALEHLQRAFSRSRYILRAMSEREQLDEGRRLSGSTADAVADRRPGGIVDADAEVAELRAVLAAVAPPSAGRDAELLAAAATRVLDAGPADPDHFAIAASLRAAADRMETGPPEAVRGHVDDAVAGLVTLLRARLPAAPSGPRSLELRQLDAEIVREPGGGS